MNQSYFAQAVSCSLISAMRAGPMPLMRDRSSTESKGLRSIKSCARADPIWMISWTCSIEALLMSTQLLVLFSSLDLFSFLFLLLSDVFLLVEPVLFGLIVPSSLV